MREFTIGKNDAGQRLDRFLGKALPLLPPALAQKYIRLKRVKVNGKGSSRGMSSNYTSMTSSLTSPRRRTASSPFLNPTLPSSTRMRTSFWRTSARAWSATPTRRRRSTPSSTTSRPTSIRRRSGTPAGRMPSPPPSATASTGTPAASSSPPRTPRPCASSTKRSGTTRSRNPISASPWGGPSRRRAASRAFF